MLKSRARKKKPPSGFWHLILMRCTNQRLSSRLALGQFLQKFGAPLGHEVQEIAPAAGRARRVAIGN